MNIFERNYKAVVLRGCINNNTKKIDMISKIKEEYKEFMREVTIGEMMTDMEAEECTDLINVCCNTLKLAGRNPEVELEKIAKKNESRKL